MVAKKFRIGEGDWLALTHATSCSIVGPKGKTIEDKSLRRISDKKFCLIGCNNLRKMWTDKSRPRGKKGVENLTALTNCMHKNK